MDQERSVLIVEDVETMQELLRYAIDQAPGFSVSGTAKNIWEARLEIERREPSLVLLDEILPGESSLDFLRELHSRGVPTVLTTSLENPDHPLPSEAIGRWIKPDWDTVDQKIAELTSLLQSPTSK